MRIRALAALMYFIRDIWTELEQNTTVNNFVEH